MVSIIIPMYNEEETITSCLDSLSMQSYSDSEIILVDDGSNEAQNPIRWQADKIQKLCDMSYYRQEHKGPGPARNLGVSHAKGDILVFVDADMTFDRDFIKKLVEPIENKKTKGTFTKEEYVSNWENKWARCWNYYQGIKDKRRIPQDYSDKSPVFRAILKKEFEKVGGFSDIGFTDDWTLSRKLGIKATLAKGAICYHHNPDSLKEIYRQARWIGKNEFISGNLIRKIINIFRYSLAVQTVISFIKAFQYKEIGMIPFSYIYSLGIRRSISMSFFGERKSK